ncbi:MAG TPA: c-type cytochrome [Bacteroidia bacterium]|nr:cytochrome c [Bacteroidota bacterium]MBK7572571.1 cytochrome c [Bacteroidota bacterium]HQW22502.1 c-type cytochrome [Bacteroidia bacterium]
MKKIISLCTVFAMIAILSACGGSDQNKQNENASDATVAETATANGNPSYDPNRGEGKFTTVEVGEKLDVALAADGKKAFDIKCSSCHKLTEEKLVGPGWKDVTKRRQAPWIMNFITNTDEMLNKDPAAQAQLEICLVRMPNQSLSDADARALLEFMRENDGVK